MGRPTSRRYLSRSPDSVLFKTVLLLIFWEQVDAQCKIVKCNTDYVAAISNPRISNKNAVFCNALRAYSQCTRNTARTCRGDLVYHSAVHIIEDRMIQHNCSKVGPTAPPRRQLPQPLPDGHVKQACDYDKVYREKHEIDAKYLHCGVFGDPHVRTFSGDFQTCKVKGSWPLLDNEYLFVQATSTPLQPSSNATVISKLTIIFKNMKQCIDQKVYQAEVGNLPAAFDDGSVNGGRRAGGSSLTIHEKEPGKYMEIHADFIGTTIRVRQLGSQLSFSLRMAEEISQAFREEQDLQLCVGGCPSSQQISRTKDLSRTHFLSMESARSLCRERLAVEDMYFESCVFDLMASGNVNLTDAAFHALEDARDFHPEPGTLHIFSKAESRAVLSLGLLLVLTLIGNINPFA
ncbi:hemojuvelin [Bufo bufo]|uniref:hemojuvelin n=1 Tax=Bufo bufo TaxID=8384 RepID=UPI001ABE11B0|nr:hemojuvelin [Bufo bufo]XP_040267178.1 hemojuvelin [Bufo bufo]XP_040267179.1 hemojuvelin [Bufo bufo]XP_040267180.1 hemojuvelin [Bufo bufo]